MAQIHGKQIRDRTVSADKLNFDVNGGSINYNGDYNLSVSAEIIGDNQSTNLSPSEQPVSNTAFYVMVNGVQIKVGDGSTASPCYFSDDSTNAVEIKDIGTQSTLFWNSSIANYILSEDDRITFKYQIASTFSASDISLDSIGEGGGGGAGYKKVATVTFEDVNDNIGEISFVADTINYENDNQVVTGVVLDAKSVFDVDSGLVFNVAGFYSGNVTQIGFIRLSNRSPYQRGGASNYEIKLNQVSIFNGSIEGGNTTGEFDVYVKLEEI